MECLKCKKQFTPKRKSAKFCSDLCRATFHQDLKQAKNQDEKIMQALKEVELIGRAERVGKLFDELMKELGEDAVKIKSAKVVKEGEKRIGQFEISAEDTKQRDEKHPLWKEGDPRERSNSFFMRYGCLTYDELSKMK